MFRGFIGCGTINNKENYFEAKFRVSLKDEIELLKELHVCDKQHKYDCDRGYLYCSKLCKLHYELMERLESIEVAINVPVRKDKDKEDNEL
jgi:hypothetical protein